MITSSLCFCCILCFLIKEGENWSFVDSRINIIEDWQPHHVHIAFGDDSNEIVVTWSTTSQVPADSMVQYGTTGFSEEAVGSAVKFTDGGNEHSTQWIHRVHINDLLPNTSYMYHCGSTRGWSDLFSFKTVQEGTGWPIRLAVYGDMGSVNAQSLSRLQMETQEGMYDAIIHVGDFAYDMDSDNGRVGDEFMKQIEPVAAYIPYMTCPGNHEQNYNFSNYKSRFSMPNYSATESLFYSWNLGPVHFVSISTEVYYFLNYGLKILENQYKWLIQDLEEAASDSSRRERPWIILYGHRPMYCSNFDQDDCTRKSCRTRIGLPVLHMYPMETLLYKYGVNLAVWAHEHSYERLLPLYNYQIMNGSEEEPYTNPRAPVHITTGSAGCKERHDKFVPHPANWSAFRSWDYGYTRITIVNHTHLHIQQISDDKDGEIIDDIWLINKKEHGRFS